VKFTDFAEGEARRLERLGFSNYPVCIAKTAISLSDDHLKRGRPRGFTATVHYVETSAGAGFNVVQMGDVMRMPGLPSSPAAERIQLSDGGVITGVE
jgi:formate--tetrahydrofolate ligase